MSYSALQERDGIFSHSLYSCCILQA